MAINSVSSYQFGAFLCDSTGAPIIKRSTLSKGLAMKLKVLLVIVGVVQIVLGMLYLIFPHEFLRSMGHTVPMDDINYPLGMLAARFLAYGVGLFVIVKAPSEHRFWILNMVFIQLIDLAVGIFYTLNGTISLTLSGFPMFNAILIASLLWIWRPQKSDTSRAAIT
jgi:hypothetical protein